MTSSKHSQTDYHLPTSELMQAGETFARLGLDCPWVGENAWCDLEHEWIIERQGDGIKWENAVRCPPAVAAAVVAFAGEVVLWCKSKEMSSGDEGFYDTDMLFDHVGLWVKVHKGWEPTPDGENIRLRRFLYENFESGQELAAAVALILAVHKAVEGE